MNALVAAFAIWTALALCHSHMAVIAEQLAMASQGFGLKGFAPSPISLVPTPWRCLLAGLKVAKKIGFSQ